MESSDLIRVIKDMMTEAAAAKDQEKLEALAHCRTLAEKDDAKRVERSERAGGRVWTVCPWCGSVLDAKRPPHCARCGQRLLWPMMWEEDTANDSHD